MTIYMRDLPDQTVGGPEVQGLILYCDGCWIEYSANRGDYFMYPDTKRVDCGYCEHPLRLVRKKVVFEDVKPRSWNKKA